MTYRGEPTPRQALRLIEGRPTPLPILAELPPLERALWVERAAETSARIRQRFGLRQEVLAVDPEREFSVTVRGIAGTLTIGAYSLEVAPKYCDTPEGDWSADLLAMMARTETHLFKWSASAGVRRHQLLFREHLAEAFAESLERALMGEAIHLYRTMEERAPVLRGRLNVARQLRSLHSRPHLIESDVARLDTDNAYNRLLHWAAGRLAVVSRDEGLSRRLRRQQERLPAVTPITRPRPLRTAPPPQYRNWQQPLLIANMLASNLGYIVADTVVAGVTLVTDMERLFERFIEVSLGEALNRLPPPHLDLFPQASATFATPTHSPGAAFSPRPDDVLSRRGRPVLIIDAKYKRLHRSSTDPLGRFHADDIYQLAASMAAHRCRLGLLVYPRSARRAGSGPASLSWRVPIFGATAYVHVLEVECFGLGAPTGLETFDEDLAASLRSLLPSEEAA
jgi:5-methylcytosine-specific restriction enzyme subunit McrC